MAIRNVCVKDVVPDPKYQAMRILDEHIVNQYRQAMRQGNQFPVMILEHGTYRLCSGYHTLEAYLQEYGPDYKTRAEVRKFKNEEEFVSTFVDQNARHGHRFSGKEIHLLSKYMSDLGMNDNIIAKLFCRNESYVFNWRDLGVTVYPSGRENMQGIVYKDMPVKSGVHIPKGAVMAEDEYDAHMNADLGIPVAKLANQISRNLEAGIVDLKDKGTVDSLIHLHTVIGTVLRGIIPKKGK